MAYNIGIANFAHMCKEKSYGVHPLWFGLASQEQLHML